MEPTRILVVEDEKHLAEGLRYNLCAEGYEVVLAGDGREALERFEEGPWSLIVLDLMLPRVDGFEVARRVRKQDPRVPVLMLTARAADEDRVRGLQCGADDYLTKPFHLEELLLRIRGMLRRSSWYRGPRSQGGLLRFGDGSWLDLVRWRAKGPRGERDLTEKEFLLLRNLIEREGETLTREELLREVWGYGPGVETRTVDNFIHRLRSYLEPEPSRPRHILSVRGRGYRFQTS